MEKIFNKYKDEIETHISHDIKNILFEENRIVIYVNGLDYEDCDYYNKIMNENPFAVWIATPQDSKII